MIKFFQKRASLLKNFILVKKLNKKWSGKNLLFCSLIYSGINYTPEKVTFCCSENKTRPIVFDENIEKFDFERYINSINKTMEINQTDKSACIGCQYFKKQRIPKFKLLHNLKGFTINNFLQCNSNCIYCGRNINSPEFFYNILPIIKKFNENGILYKNCTFHWGGGEPTIYREFEDIVLYLIDNNYRQVINSSALKFSETILKGLSQKSLILQISPDSGTKETYLKIKGQNGYERVWQNIKKYCKYPKNVFVKYIIFSFNSDKEEIIQFVQKCIESGVKNIVISPEAKSFRNDDDWEYGNITEKEIKAAALLNKLAVKEHINVELSPIWRKENISLINELNKQKILL